MELAHALTQSLGTVWGMPLSGGDAAGFATGLACVWLTTRGSIWNFPVGIVNCLILGLVFFDQRLFADAALQLVFIWMAVLGWRRWRTGGLDGEDAPVFRSTAREQRRLAGIALALTASLAVLMYWLKGSLPLFDALITALSLCAQWQLNRRQLESWLWWMAVDLIAIPVYWSRDLPLIAVLYVIFLLLCVKGWLGWRRRVGERWRLVPA